MDKKSEIRRSPLLHVVNLSKRFGTLSALRNINLKLFPGDVIGITGQSGSGKSTLAKILAGIYTPDEGKIYFSGNLLHAPTNVRSIGIEVIHQTPRLAENLDITSNVFLGNEIPQRFLSKILRIPAQNEMDQKTAELLAELGVEYDSLRDEVCNLSLETRQMIAIAQVMTGSPKLIIVDEPMEVLSYPYQKIVLNLISQWQREGKSILFFSNNLDHLLDVTDRIIVMREGYCAAEFNSEEADREEIIASLVGTTNYQQLLPIIWALDNYYEAQKSANDLHRSQMLVDQDMINQESLYNQLVNHLTEQITTLDSTNQTLQNAQRRLIADSEEERKALAREIHDQIIQDLLSTNFQLEALDTLNPTPEKLHEDISQIRSNIRKMVDELRIICGNLRPPTIDSLGLNAAIQSYAQEWSKRFGIEIHLHLDPEIGRISEAIELSIYRIVQESLNNIHKHSSATVAWITLERTSPRALMITIEDNGEGVVENFDLASFSKSGHYGLVGIEERVKLLGGRLRIRNKAEGGLLIQAEIPHPKN
ncbi:MAG: ATP-binding cassette domain-containing protein [Brevefilum sp.]|nr:ATP-binding cassette domain-containing protein [Brevefilum sp.]